MRKLWTQIKRIWNYCIDIAGLLVSKTIKGTGKLAKGSATMITFTLSFMMFVVLISGLLLTAAGVSFFNLPLVREGPPMDSQQVPIAEGGAQAV